MSEGSCEKWWMKREWTNEHQTLAQRFMRTIRLLPPDLDEDVIQDIALKYGEIIRESPPTKNPGAWLYTLLFNRAWELHLKETRIRGHRREEDRPKEFVAFDDQQTPLQSRSTIRPDIEPVVAHYLLDPVGTLQFVESKDCGHPNKRRLVVRAALNDWNLSHTERQRAAKHSLECNKCLDIYRFFRCGELKKSMPLQEWCAWWQQHLRQESFACIRSCVGGGGAHQPRVP